MDIFYFPSKPVILTFLSPWIKPQPPSAAVISRIFIQVNPGILIKFSNYVKLSKIMQTCQKKNFISNAKYNFVSICTNQISKWQKWQNTNNRLTKFNILGNTLSIAREESESWRAVRASVLWSDHRLANIIHIVSAPGPRPRLCLDPSYLIRSDWLLIFAPFHQNFSSGHPNTHLASTINICDAPGPALPGHVTLMPLSAKPKWVQLTQARWARQD